MMPGRDGWQVCRDMKQHPTLGRNVRVVMVTALDDWVNKRQALQTGADDFVEKPFELSKLAATVERNIKLLVPTSATHPLSVDYHQLLRDSLTRLPTVAATIDGIRKAVQDRGELVILYFNFDRYSKVEEVYGWEKLDSVLETTGEAMRDFLSKSSRWPRRS